MLAVEGLAGVGAEELAPLARLPFVIVGVGAAPPAVRAVVDLVAEDAAALEPLVEGFVRAPLAATAAALLLRFPPPDPWAGLVAESTTYSMLQAGPEFQRWCASRAASPAQDDRPRVAVLTHDRFTEVTLTRPERHNALDVAMREQLLDALGTALARPGPVVVLGEGPSFSSGGDLDEFGTAPDPAHAHLVRLSRSLAAQVSADRERFVVGVHGRCLGAGLELPAFATRVVAADDARLGLPELELGLVPGAGGTVSLPARAGRHRTMELLLRAGTISGSAALAWGLVDEVVPRARLRARCVEIAESRL